MNGGDEERAFKRPRSAQALVQAAYAEVLVIRIGMSLREAAREMGVSYETVRQALHRAGLATPSPPGGNPLAISIVRGIWERVALARQLVGRVSIEQLRDIFDIPPQYPIAELRGRPPVLDRETRKEMIRRLWNEGWTYPRLTGEFHLSRGYISVTLARCRREGLEVRRARRGQAPR